MLGVDDRFPQLDVVVQQGVDSASRDSILRTGASGRWTILFFWPRDFTSVCPTDIVSYNDLIPALAERDTDLIGASTDSANVHLAWRRSDPRLAACEFPWIADERHELSGALGIYNPAEDRAQRATFIYDPDGIIQHVTVNAYLVGRNSSETLRVLDAIRSGDETPCNWMPGDPVLNRAI